MSKGRILVVSAAVIGLSAYVLSRSFDEPEAEGVTDAVLSEDLRTAIFAGGCFWCMEASFEKLPGVIEVESGYTGGSPEKSTADEVPRSTMEPLEAIRVTYDVSRITYDDLLEVFWRSIDPTDAGGQFADRGSSYMAAILVANDQQRAAAERSKKALEDSERFEDPIVTPIRNASKFNLAKDDHQDYYKKSPWKYKQYRFRSGRDQFIDSAWGDERNYAPRRDSQHATDTDGSKRPVYRKPSDAEIKGRLTPLQYRVTQQKATESPFENEFWDHTEAGIYVDIVSGEPLFSSRDKYKSGTGWPSFTRPLFESNIVEKTENNWIGSGTEVRSKHGDSHLGHVFHDGPSPTGLRYCINSAALRFIPAKQLEAEGHQELVVQFEADFESQSERD